MHGIRSYRTASSLEDALLRLDGKVNKIIAGGTGIVMKFGGNEYWNIDLLNISQIEELKNIEMLDDGTIEIGALVTFSQLTKSKTIQKNAAILKESASSMDSARIKNVATIGGNICDGEFYYDSISTLFALNARLRIQSVSGKREIYFSELYDSLGNILIKGNELVTHIIIDKSSYKDLYGKYIKYFVRKSFSPSSLGIAIAARFADDQISELRVGISVDAPSPIRCNNAASYVIGKPLILETYQQFASLAVRELAAKTDWCTDETNRTFIADALFQRALSDTYMKYKERDVIRISDYKNES